MCGFKEHIHRAAEEAGMELRRLLIGELLHRRKLEQSDVGHAAKVGLGTWFGIVLGVVSKLALGFAMLGLFFFAWYF